MANKKILTFANRSSVKVSEWKIEVGQTIYHGRVLLVYQEESTGQLSKLKSKCVGTVVNLFVKQGEVLNPGDPVLEVEEGCSHPTVVNDLCAECGADLQREGVSESNATVPMVHHIPQLKVSQQEAEMIGKADTERLLKDKKLVLLVDLDQTLIHTTHDNIPNNIKDVHHFQLGTSAWYHTRLRPNTAHFLKEMSAYFELHICTFGVRPYAHMVANILDRDHSLFSSRILSRDECFSHDSKVANLQALFPNGDELVCIIDDRKDVWNNSPNLIPVKPYVFFTNTGDINDVNLPPITKHSDFFAKGVKLKKRNGAFEASEVPKVSEVPAAAEVPQSAEPNETESHQPEEFDVEDEDDYLLYLESILKKVHSLFYKVYNKEVEGTAHVRWVLEQLRGSVLKGCEIVFSGLVPLHEGIENSEPYLVATDLGATIGKTVSASTTHIVAAREGTAKLHESKKFPKIKVVNPQWLTTCLYRWEKVDERLFPLVKVKESEKKGKDSVPLSLTFDDVVSMQQEVQAEFNTDSSDSVESTELCKMVVGNNEETVSESKTVSSDKTCVVEMLEAFGGPSCANETEGSAKEEACEGGAEVFGLVSDAPEARGKVPDTKVRASNGSSEAAKPKAKASDTKVKAPDTKPKAPDTKPKAPDTKPKTPNTKPKSSNTREKELANVTKLIMASRKRQADPVKLDFLKEAGSEFLKNFHIPKKVRINVNPQVRMIESRNSTSPAQLSSMDINNKGLSKKLRKTRLLHFKHGYNPRVCQFGQEGESLMENQGLECETAHQDGRLRPAEAETCRPAPKSETKMPKVMEGPCRMEEGTSLSGRLAEMSTKMANLIREHETEKANMIAEHRTVMANLSDLHQSQLAEMRVQMANMKREYETKMTNLIAEHNTKLANLSDLHQSQLAGMRVQMTNMVREHETKTANLSAEHKTKLANLSDLHQSVGYITAQFVNLKDKTESGQHDFQT